MTFSVPEREFLRQSARAELSYADLVNLVPDGLDWAGVVALSLAHQLDGVLAWRLRQPEIEAVCGVKWGDWGRGHGAWVDSRMAGWIVDAGKVSAGLAAAGVRHAFAGCPSSYLPYGMDAFPRVTDDMDLVVLNAHYDLAMGAVAGPGWANEAEDRLGGPWGEAEEHWAYGPGEKEPTPRLGAGLAWHMDWECRMGPYLDTSWAGISETGMLDRAHEADLWGAGLPVLSPEATACYHGARTYAKAFSARQSLGELAHIHNAVAGSPFDWGTALGILQDCLRMGERGLLSLPRSALRDAWAARWRQESTAAWIVWAWQLADAVYGCIPQAAMAEALTLIGGECDPSVWVRRDDGSSVAAGWRLGWDPEALVFGETTELQDKQKALAEFLEVRVPAIVVPAGLDCWPRSEWEVMVLRAAEVAE